MIFPDRQRQIDDGEQGEDERLDRSDEQVEELDEERHERDGEGKIEESDRDLGLDDRSDDDEQQFADEDVEEQAGGERDRARDLFDDVDQDQRGRRFCEMGELPAGVTAHVLPTGGGSHTDDSPLAYRNLSAARTRIERAYQASGAYLDAL